MKYSKPHLPYEDQVDLLIRRGLDCPDRAGTLFWLKRIGYYRLSAYFIPFKDAATGNFRPGTTFEQIIDLYRFDADLRRLVREALDRIEISVRAVITYEIGKDLGVFGDADAANFAATFNHADFMRILRRERDVRPRFSSATIGPSTHQNRNCPYGWRRSLLASARSRRCMNT